MNKRILTIILLGILNLHYAPAFAEPLNKIDITDKTVDSIYKIRLRTNISQFPEKEILVDGTPYQILTMPEYGHTSEIGKPQLPAIRFLLAVPCLSNISLKITEGSYSVLPEDYKMYPVQEPVPLGQYHEQKFTIDKSFYNTNVFYPARVANISA